MPDKFTCARCSETFDKVWSDEESWAEARQLFGPLVDRVPTDLLCDTCYDEFVAWYRTHRQKRQN